MKYILIALLFIVGCKDSSMIIAPKSNVELISTDVTDSTPTLQDIWNEASANDEFITLDTFKGKEFRLDDKIVELKNTDMLSGVTSVGYNRFYEVGEVVLSMDLSGGLKTYKKITNDGWNSELAHFVKIEYNTPIGDAGDIAYVKGSKPFFYPTTNDNDIDIWLGIGCVDINCDVNDNNEIDPITSHQSVWNPINIPMLGDTIDAIILKVGEEFYYYNLEKNAIYQGDREYSEFFLCRSVLDTNYWQEVPIEDYILILGDINTNRPFDGINNTYATAETSATYTIRPAQKFDGLTVSGLLATHIQVVFKNEAGEIQSTIEADIDNSIDDSGNFIGEATTKTLYNIPDGETQPQVINGNGTIEITITGDTIRIGGITPILSIDIGITLLEFDPSLKDFSPMQIGKGGEVDYINGVAVYDIKATVMFETAKMDKMLRLLKHIKKTPISIDFSDSMNSAPNWSKGIFAELQILGYINSSKIKPLVTDNKEYYKKYSQLDITVREIG